jgi:gluconate 2-dehydrogenase gamma chain
VIRDDDDSGLEPDEVDQPDSGLSRRTLLRTAGAASLALPVVAAGQEKSTSQAARPRFFTSSERALVDELAETIIPADGHSPGAKAAGVVQEIERRLAEQPALDPDAAPRKKLWRDGLNLVDAEAKRLGGASFVKVTPEQRIAVLTEMARNELAPRTPAELFFVELKREVVRAYYTSQIGIQQELEYKGNSHLEQFVGHDVATVPLRKR